MVCVVRYSKAPPHATAAENEFVVDMSVLEEKVAELNALAGDGKGELVKGPGGETRLKVWTGYLLLSLYTY